MDYGMPRADTLPLLATALSEVPAPSNRLRVRSGGEGGTTPALAAVINAIVDALAELGVCHIEMPATPERVWHALRAAAARRILIRPMLRPPAGIQIPTSYLAHGEINRV